MLIFFAKPLQSILLVVLVAFYIFHSCVLNCFRFRIFGLFPEIRDEHHRCTNVNPVQCFIRFFIVVGWLCSFQHCNSARHCLQFSQLRVYCVLFHAKFYYSMIEELVVFLSNVFFFFFFFVSCVWFLPNRRVFYWFTGPNIASTHQLLVLAEFFTFYPVF